MKTLTLIKSSMVIMTVLIIACLSFIIYKITDLSANRKAKNSTVLTEMPQTKITEHTIAMDSDENVLNSVVCDSYICIFIGKQNMPNRMVVIRPKTGETVQTVFFGKK